MSSAYCWVNKSGEVTSYCDNWDMEAWLRKYSIHGNSILAVYTLVGDNNSLSVIADCRVHTEEGLRGGIFFARCNEPGRVLLAIHR